MFERAHHRRIARVLQSLDGARLSGAQCLFGGGTAIALRHHEFRESVDIDLLVSDREGYRTLRHLLAPAQDLAPIQRPDTPPIALARPFRADQYGIRTTLLVEDVGIKFEIVLEARFVLDRPGRGDVICGVATLTTTDMATSKLLANADRWADDSALSRDAIDLAMMALPPRALRPAIAKATTAYGPSVVSDMQRALTRLIERPEHLARCLTAMSMRLAPAQMVQALRRLQRSLARAAAT